MGYKDENKPKLELIDPDFIGGMARAQEIGDDKHRDHHWRGGVSVSAVLGAIKRHIADIERGKYIDKETGLQHAYLAACGLQYIAHYVRHYERYEEFFDQPYGGSSTISGDMGRRDLPYPLDPGYFNQAAGGGGGTVQGPERGGVGRRFDPHSGPVLPGRRETRPGTDEENED